MSIFSRIKKAKKAAEDHKKATAQTQASDETKPLPSPYKHVPTHAAQDALAATPTRWRPEEARAKIAAARKRRSEMIASSPASIVRYSTNSELNVPLSSKAPTRSDRSIDFVMKQPQSYHSLAHEAPRGTLRLPATQKTSVDQIYAPSARREVAVLPPRRKRPHIHGQITSSNPSTTRRKSPLSNESLEEEPETFAHSSRNPSSSILSSDESTLRHSGSSQSQNLLKIPDFPMPKSANQQKQHASPQNPLPYTSDEDLSPATNTVPSWRYEDFSVETDPPVLVDTVSSKHSRSSSSLSRSIFTRKSSLSVAAH